MSPNWIYNSECYSLEFSEQLVQNYFLCAYPLRREGLTNSSAKRQDYSKARESPGLKRIFFRCAYGTEFSPGFESYGLI
jgi:hypothetical protein